MSRSLLAGTDVGANDADRIVNGERQRDGTPAAAAIEHELRFGRTATRQRREQLESPVILIRRQYLPATFLFVVVAPDPVATTELGWKLPRLLVKINYLLTLGRRIAHQMPDGLRRLIPCRLVNEVVVVIVNGLAAIHAAVAIRFRFARALAAAGDGGDTRRPLAR